MPQCLKDWKERENKMKDTFVLMGDERAALRLRALYSRHGYTQYKMNKFEEYDLYVQNKDFLISDAVITFTGTNGKLLALKPDVTLSIVKNTGRGEGTRKVYYQENVYRVSGKTKEFREIMQVGLECIGDVDAYCQLEVLMLAAKSLLEISPEAVLDVSHAGVLAAYLNTVSDDAAVRARLLCAIGEKNLHGLRAICAEAGVQECVAEKLGSLISCYGKPSEVLKTLTPILADAVPDEMLNSFASLLLALENSEIGKCVRLDFSQVGDVGYYNGIIFKGFVAGVPTDVLSGGEYGGLMKKMGRGDDAIGFAVYLDALERFEEEGERYDVDTAVLYGADADPAELFAAIDALKAGGQSVAAYRTLPLKLRYCRLCRFDEKEGVIREANA